MNDVGVENSDMKRYDNTIAKKLTAEDEDTAIEDDEPKNVYKPPPTGSSPDHYIDDA
ncbi:hypothetical protein RR48_04326 [Papilio machaon]|uniref:Uncharacterized protein n=1 Tax=Papilio machaon TaxID=76193 RepID=A0A0N1IPL7_PAPMA|nr:hypothetical protein RR48_04326 [Papilio machaon]